MKALVVYESISGNTEAIARAVAERLETSFDVTVADVRTLPAVGDADLLIVGAPTHAFSMSRPRPRAEANRHGTVKAGAPRIGIREYLDCSPWLTGVHAAAFDTKLRKPSLPGSAARKAYRRLHGLGCQLRSTCCDRQTAKVSHLHSNQQRLTAQTRWGSEPEPVFGRP